ncbi:MAG TPA: hypothetical protein V6D47_13965 [Oscillatoriaceae cyanobacterium]
MKRRILWAIAIALASPQAALAADRGMPGMDMSGRPMAMPSTQPMSCSCTTADALAPFGMAPMPGMNPLMTRDAALGSGTSVLPVRSPMRMVGFEAGGFSWMLHGNAVLGWDHQGGPRGTDTWTAPNWAMLMGSRYAGPGILDLHLMMSLDALTLPPGGTPELFQTGETYQGVPLVDKQHPHDLFAELAAMYTLNLQHQTALFLYGGPAGEPALGPTAFMHRPSAMDNPWAPLGHHWQDATHISYGVVTAGVRHQSCQLEASLFNGREPDENRYNFDFGPLDSYAARFSYFPGSNWISQVSFGHLTDPEVTSPGVDINRTTASLTYVSPRPGGAWSTSFIWGQNVELESTPLTLQSYAVESDLDLDRANHVYGRFELVDKNELYVPQLGNDMIFRVGALTLGGVHDLVTSPRGDLGLGADFTVYSKPAALDPYYGFNPVSFLLYVRVRPPLMSAS